MSSEASRRFAPAAPTDIHLIGFDMIETSASVHREGQGKRNGIRAKHAFYLNGSRTTTCPPAGAGACARTWAPAVEPCFSFATKGGSVA